MTNKPVSRTGTQVSMSGSVGGHNIQIGHAAGDVVIVVDRPRYRLDLLQPNRIESGRQPRSRRQPSYLLDPQHEVVPYLPRPAEEQRLIEWLNDQNEPLSVLLVAGPGGQGKTRLAGHLATNCNSQGWAVVQAVERGPRLSSHSDPDAKEPLRDEKPLLVVADYVERWQLDVLVQMVEDLPFAFPGRHVRVVLLARPSPGLWDTIAAELDNGRVNLADPLTLGDLTTDRVSAFKNAAIAFGRAMALDCPVPDPPANLGHPSYGSPLTLHMAALAAVCAADGAESAPEPQAMSTYLLKHERRAWAAVAGGDPVRIAALEDVAWLATLFGPAVHRSMAITLLRTAGMADGDAEAARLLYQYELLYPPSCSSASEKSDTNSATLQPLRPDRFGEDLVSAVLTNRPHASTLLGELLLNRDPACIGAEFAIRRCLIVLAAAATRHEKIRAIICSLLQSRPDLAFVGGATVLRFVVNFAPDNVAEAVDRELPAYNTELLRPAVDLAQRLADSYPANSASSERASRLDKLGNRLADVGRYDEAIAPSDEAVHLYRHLSDTNPALRFNLAGSLDNLGNRFTDTGRHSDALPPTVEAADILRQIAEVNPTVRPRLAQTLSNLSIRFSVLARREEALAVSAEAARICRHLAAEDPGAFNSYLATALVNLGMALSNLRRHWEALAATKEAAEIYHQLAEASPTSFEPSLAMTLNNLGMMLSNFGRRTDALAVTENAAQIYRRLAQANPSAFDHYLANTLSNLSVDLSNSARHEEAITVSDEAITLYRRLALINARAFEPDLARSLLTSAWVRLQAGVDVEVAHDLAAESSSYHERIRLERPEFTDRILGALRELAKLFTRLGRSDLAEQIRPGTRKSED